ncbi:uncharacterized protein [Nicotiana sylvestris]|uniref:uncharacterized protein n=1 Tax=Nicotiana sylvestris TaxID=4096 RepID=UPI00388C7245
MASDFTDRFRFNTKNAPDVFYIQNLKKKPTETFRKYATHWRSKAAKVIPALEEEQMNKFFVWAQDPRYYERLMLIESQKFSDIIKLGERIEKGIKSGMVTNFEALQATNKALQFGVYKSWKLKDVERRYAAHEKELLAVVHCLLLWRHYLLGTPFMVKTDNTVVSHFMTHPKLNGRQARWQELIVEFHVNLEYRSGKTNHVANVLRRRANLASVCLLATLRESEVATTIKDQIHDLLIKDPAAQYFVDLVGQGKTRQFYMEDGFLKVKGNQLYIPKVGDL